MQTPPETGRTLARPRSVAIALVALVATVTPVALLALVTPVALLAHAPAAAAAEPLPTVARIDLQRYAGTWHEIARLPNRFQAQCVAEVTATYTPRADGAVDVVNRCRTKDGSIDAADGLARPQDDTNARLTVSFLPALLRWLPVGRGDYWVIELDPAYRWVVVGEPRREYLWVLAREPALPAGTLESLLGRAREAGFPVERVMLSAQRPAPDPVK